MVVALPKQPGQKEGRYAHLLAGEPDIPAPSRSAAATGFSAGLEDRVAELEERLEDLQNRLQALENRLNPEG